ncbi:MAG: hypothetical protein RDV48_00925 [Candidatus Eremiobacteraeota bacterium]|nr:hypothetical protein [Candidatus Eremiobacteraeota bacterium]
MVHDISVNFHDTVRSMVERPGEKRTAVAFSRRASWYWLMPGDEAISETLKRAKRERLTVSVNHNAITMRITGAELAGDPSSFSPLSPLQDRDSLRT